MGNYKMKNKYKIVGTGYVGVIMGDFRNV